MQANQCTFSGRMIPIRPCLFRQAERVGLEIPTFCNLKPDIIFLTSTSDFLYRQNSHISINVEMDMFDPMRTQQIEWPQSAHIVERRVEEEHSRWSRYST